MRISRNKVFIEYKALEKDKADEESIKKCIAQIKEQLFKKLSVSVIINRVPSHFQRLSNCNRQDLYFDQKSQEIKQYPRSGSFQVTMFKILIFSRLFSGKLPQDGIIIFTVKNLIRSVINGEGICKYGIRQNLHSSVHQSFKTIQKKPQQNLHHQTTKKQSNLNKCFKHNKLYKSRIYKNQQSVSANSSFHKYRQLQNGLNQNKVLLQKLKEKIDQDRLNNQVRHKEINKLFKREENCISKEKSQLKFQRAKSQLQLSLIELSSTKPYLKYKEEQLQVYPRAKNRKKIIKLKQPHLKYRSQYQISLKQQQISKTLLQQIKDKKQHMKQVFQQQKQEFMSCEQKIRSLEHKKQIIISQFEFRQKESDQLLNEITQQHKNCTIQQQNVSDQKFHFFQEIQMKSNQIKSMQKNNEQTSRAYQQLIKKQTILQIMQTSLQSKLDYIENSKINNRSQYQSPKISDYPSQQKQIQIKSGQIELVISEPTYSIAIAQKKKQSHATLSCLKRRNTDTIYEGIVSNCQPNITQSKSDRKDEQKPVQTKITQSINIFSQQNLLTKAENKQYQPNFPYWLVIRNLVIISATQAEESKRKKCQHKLKIFSNCDVSIGNLINPSTNLKGKFKTKDITRPRGQLSIPFYQNLTQRGILNLQYQVIEIDKSQKIVISATEQKAAGSINSFEHKNNRNAKKQDFFALSSEKYKSCEILQQQSAFQQDIILEQAMHMFNSKKGLKSKKTMEHKVSTMDNIQINYEYNKSEHCLKLKSQHSIPKSVQSPFNALVNKQKILMTRFKILPFRPPKKTQQYALRIQHRKTIFKTEISKPGVFGIQWKDQYTELLAEYDQISFKLINNCLPIGNAIFQCKQLFGQFGVKKINMFNNLRKLICVLQFSYRVI